MNITSSNFFRSILRAQDAPQDRPSFALIGRSNVGKSSLINCLLGRKSLARTSGTPGKTQRIHYFLINEAWYLVDLPGYGWASVSQTKRAEWVRRIRRYLTRVPLKRLFLLLDGRHPQQPIDMQFLSWLVTTSIPYALVLTKADQCKKAALDRHVALLKALFEEADLPMPPLFITHSRGKAPRGIGGCQALRAYMGTLLHPDASKN